MAEAPPGPRAAGHPGHPLRRLVAGETGQRPVRAARRRLGHHPVLDPAALPAAADPGVSHRRRDPALPAPGHRESAPDGRHDYPGGTQGRRERLKPGNVVVVAPATAVAGAATTTPCSQGPQASGRHCGPGTRRRQVIAGDENGNSGAQRDQPAEIPPSRRRDRLFARLPRIFGLMTWDFSLSPG